MEGWEKARQNFYSSTEGTWWWRISLFRDTVETFQSGEKLTGVLEALEKNQTQQLQLMNQFMNTFMQAMQSKDK